MFRATMFAAVLSTPPSAPGTVGMDQRPPAFPPPVVHSVQFGGGFESSDYESYRDQAEQGYSGATGGRNLSADVAAAAGALGIDLATVSQYVTGAVTVNPTSTRLIQQLVEDSDRDCARTPRAYRLSCVQDRFRSLSRQLPRRGAATMPWYARR